MSNMTYFAERRGLEMNAVFEKAGHTVRLGEFELCPSWVPGKDRRWRTTPTILKTLGVDGFDHSASWPAKVRNVPRLGSR